MSIYKINKNLPRLSQITTLNDMVIEVNGKVDQGKFNKQEIIQIYKDLGIDRKFAYRDAVIGNTTVTYTGWSHVKVEDGYSIWKYSPTGYVYNTNNEVYFDNKLLSLKGEADSETATAFDYVFFYNGDSGSGYIDYTAEAATEGGTEFSIMNSTNDYLYLGYATTFAGTKFEWQTRGSGYTLVVEYYDGASWTALTTNTNDLDDETSSLESNGRITWTIPDDWTTTTVNSQTKYWIRISTSATPVTTAKAYYIIPGNCVTALLALSSEEILNEEWAWCSYSTEIYVTIRNIGNSAYEGAYYVTSSSSATNLQNFFVFNHTYSANYQDTTYDPVMTKTSDYVITTGDGIIVLNPGSANLTATLPTAVGNEGKQFTIKVLDMDSGYSVLVDGDGIETIDGSPNYAFNSDYDFITVVSNGSNWLIIGSNWRNL